MAGVSTSLAEVLSFTGRNAIKPIEESLIWPLANTDKGLQGTRVVGAILITTISFLAQSRMDNLLRDHN